MVLPYTIAEFLIAYIVFFFIYLLTATLEGVTQARIARACGDDTPSIYGFETLNPWEHISFIGILFFLFFRFGLSQVQPINPFNIEQPYPLAKLGLIFHGKTLVNALLSIISFTASLLIFGNAVAYNAAYITGADTLHTVRHLQALLPGANGITIIICFFLSGLFFVNILMMIINLISQTCWWFFAYKQYNGARNLEQMRLVLIFLPIIILFLAFSELYVYLSGFITSIAQTIVRILGK